MNHPAFPRSFERECERGRYRGYPRSHPTPGKPVAGFLGPAFRAYFRQTAAIVGPIMAAPESTSAMFRALRSANVDPDLAYEAAVNPHSGDGSLEVVARDGARLTVRRKGVDRRRSS